MDALLIREQRQDERLDNIEARLAELERLWQAISTPVAARATNPRSHFRDLLNAHLDEAELCDAAFDLNVDYESLPGEGKRVKAREMVLLLEREGRVYQLTNWLQQRRPNVNWPSI